MIRTKRFVLLLERLGFTADPQLVSDTYISHLSEAHFLMDGARELLEHLVSELPGEVPLVILTNGLSTVQRSRFAKAGMDRYFPDMIISEEVGVQKPQPEVFRIALERAGRHTPSGQPVLPERAIMIGDNLNSDIRGALEAGLEACWANLRGAENTTAVEPTHTVTSLKQIPDILGL